MRVNKTFTVTAATPIHLLTGATLGATVKAAGLTAVYASRITFQLREGATGLGYVMMGIYGVDTNGDPRVPASTGLGDLTRVLSIPLAAGQPGGEFTDTASPFLGNSGADIDLRAIWLDGSHTGDKITVSWEQA